MNQVNHDSSSKRATPSSIAETEKGTNQLFNTYAVSNIPKGLFKAVIAPRPIGWISSVSNDGTHNLAPFSYFNAVCDSPPTVMVSMTNKHIEGGPKDTLTNIESTGHFVVNIVTRDLYEQMNLTSADLPRNVDEFEYANLEWLSSSYGPSRRVKLSPIHLECKYFKSVELPKDGEEFINRMIIGTVVAVHIKPDIIDRNGKIDYQRLPLLSRMGYNDYLAVDCESIFQGFRPETSSQANKF